MRQRLLHHFTCQHAGPLIIARGEIVPARQPMLDGAELVWLTDDNMLDRASLGLSSEVLDCDRMTYHFIVPQQEAIPWREWADRVCHTDHLRRARSMLELGRAHETWWVSEQPMTWAEYGV